MTNKQLEQSDHKQPKEPDYKQQLRDFWYSDFMQKINPCYTLEDIERIKSEMLKKRGTK